MSKNPTLRGLYKLIATNAETGEERVLADWFPNLILDSGLNGIGASNMMTQCFVGSGSTPPVNTNNVMEHLLATTTISSDVVGAAASGDGGYGWLRRTYSFGAGVAAGNLSEIGVGATSSLLFSRSLIKDGDGNPTTITVLSNEFFSVLYEVRLYPPTADATFDVTIDSIVHHCVMRPAMIGSTSWVPYGCVNIVSTQGSAGAATGVGLFDGDIGATTAVPSGASVGLTYATAAPYSNNSLAMAMASPLIGLTQGNFGTGIKSMLFGTNMGEYQVSFTPPLAKDNTRTLLLNMAIAWTRAA